MVRISANCPWIFMMIISCTGIVSTSDCTNEFWMSIVAKSLSFFVYITDASKKYVAAVELVTSYLYVHALCMLPL